jgi:transcriptional regulator with XRE-family HTH domain
MNQKTATPVKPTFDKAIGERFGFFRNKYISTSQAQAALQTGINQSYFSLIETGRKSPGYKVINSLVNKYNLNTEWLLTGKGEPVMKQDTPDTNMGTTLQRLIAANRELETKVLAMEKTMLIMEKNQEFFLARIEKFMEQQQK